MVSEKKQGKDRHSVGRGLSFVPSMLLSEYLVTLRNWDCGKIQQWVLLKMCVICWRGCGLASVSSCVRSCLGCTLWGRSSAGCLMRNAQPGFPCPPQQVPLHGDPGCCCCRAWGFCPRSPSQERALRVSCANRQYLDLLSSPIAVSLKWFYPSKFKM